MKKDALSGEWQGHVWQSFEQVAERAALMREKLVLEQLILPMEKGPRRATCPRMSLRCKEIPAYLRYVIVVV